MQTENEQKVEIIEPHTKALISIEKINALEVFTDKGVEPILEEISKKVALLQPDVSTSKGRNEIKSMASKIARSKTLLDGVGKELVAEWKAKTKVVDASRKKMRDHLDGLKETTRAPLTEWERVETERRLKFENGMADLIAFQTIEHNASVEFIRDIIGDINSIKVDESWGDLQERAEAAQSYALGHAEGRLKQKIDHDAQQAELEQLRKQQAEQQAKAVEEDRVRQAAERETREAIKKAEAEKQAAIDAAILAERRAFKAESEARINAEAKVKAEADQQERQRVEAAQKEEARIKFEATKKAAAEAKRKDQMEDANIRAMKCDETREALSEICDKEFASEILEAIMRDEIPHVNFVD